MGIAHRLLEAVNPESSRASEASIQLQEALTAKGELEASLGEALEHNRALFERVSADAGRLEELQRYVYGVETELGQAQREAREARGALGAARALQGMCARDGAELVDALAACGAELGEAMRELGAEAGDARAGRESEREALAREAAALRAQLSQVLMLGLLCVCVFARDRSILDVDWVWPVVPRGHACFDWPRSMYAVCYVREQCFKVV